MISNTSHFEKFHLCSIVTLLLLGVFIAILAKPGSSLFSWHPFCMSASFFMLIPFSTKILKYRSVLNYQTRKRAHWMSQLFSMFLVLFGFYAIYENKNRLNKLHFTTNHGLSGLITVICMAIQSFVFGIPANWKVFGFSMSKFKKWHVFFSVVSFLASMVTLILAFGTKFMDGKVDYWFGSGLVIVVYGGLAIGSFRKSFL